MTTRVLVIADTHIPGRRKALPDRLVRELGSADLIVHLGDFTTMLVLDLLPPHVPFVAVHGNNDSTAVRSAFPASTSVEVEGHELRLIHGHLGGTTATKAAQAVEGGDAVLFGHSHQPYNRWEDGRLLFNPGSPTDRRWTPYCSFGVLEIGNSIAAEIVPLM